jgi:hypothetical protein
MTRCPRLRAWQKAGVPARIDRVQPARLSGAHQLDFTRVAVGSRPVRAVLGEKTDPSPRPHGCTGIVGSEFAMNGLDS